MKPQNKAFLFYSPPLSVSVPCKATYIEVGMQAAVTSSNAVGQVDEVLHAAGSKAADLVPTISYKALYDRLSLYPAALKHFAIFLLQTIL